MLNTETKTLVGVVALAEAREIEKAVSGLSAKHLTALIEHQLERIPLELIMERVQNYITENNSHTPSENVVNFSLMVREYIIATSVKELAEKAVVKVRKG